MWSHRSARSNAGFQPCGTTPRKLELGQRARTSTWDTPSLPRSNTKVVFARDYLRAATSVAQRDWSVDSQANSPAATTFPGAACEGRGGTSTTFLRTAAKSRSLGWKVASSIFESGEHSWCESCLRHAHLSSISKAPSNPLREPVAYVLLPTKRHPIRILLPKPSLVRLSWVSAHVCRTCVCLPRGAPAQRDTPGDI